MKPETPEEEIPPYDPNMNYDPRLHQVRQHNVLCDISRLDRVDYEYQMNNSSTQLFYPIIINILLTDR